MQGLRPAAWRPAAWRPGGLQLGGLGPKRGLARTVITIPMLMLMLMRMKIRKSHTLDALERSADSAAW